MARKVTLSYIRETYSWCSMCQQLLKHDRGYCPLFPGVDPPQVLRRLRVPIHTPMGTDTHEYVPGKKWTKCVCMVHTCHDNPVKLVYMGFERASRSHYAFPGANMTMCARTPTVLGGVVKDPFRSNTCLQCMSVFLKRAHVYRDFL